MNKQAFQKVIKKIRDQRGTSFPKAIMTTAQQNKRTATVNCGGEWLTEEHTDEIINQVLNDSGFNALLIISNAKANIERNSLGAKQIRITF